MTNLKNQCVNKASNERLNFNSVSQYKMEILSLACWFEDGDFQGLCRKILHKASMSGLMYKN